MPLAKVNGVVLAGVRGELVTVEVDVSQGLPGIGMVGLPDTSVSEAKWRARCAVTSAGHSWPDRRITVNLSPADVRKQGAGLDLPIAVGVLAADGQVPHEHLRGLVLLGELGLDGTVRATRGAIAGALAVRTAGLATLVLPRPNAVELARVEGVRIVVVDHLTEVVDLLRSTDLADVPTWTAPSRAQSVRPGPDLRDVRGQHRGRLALEVAAAGGHHLAFVGAPGLGKTLMAERLPGLLPDLSEQEALDVAVLHSVAGHPRPDAEHRRPPLRFPHHSASAASVLGTARGGRVVPGAVTLAHSGVLLLDEAPEFSRQVLEGLRQPLESGSIAVDRTGWSGTLPAGFQLVITANPCPCGGRTGIGADCTCAPAAIRRYAARLSGPLMDRIDIRVPIERPSAADLGSSAEPTVDVAHRVQAARERAIRRLESTPWSRMADIPATEVRRRWPPSDDAARLLAELERRASNLRGIDRVLRLAWTLADLGGRERPSADDIALGATLRGRSLGWSP